jgi:hypothetical protein
MPNSIPPTIKHTDIEARLVAILKDETSAGANVWSDKFIPIYQLEGLAIQFFTGRTSIAQSDNVTDRDQDLTSIVLSCKGKRSKTLLDQLEFEVRAILKSNRNLDNLLPQPFDFVNIDREYDLEAEEMIGFHVIQIQCNHFYGYKNLGELNDDTFI